MLNRTRIDAFSLANIHHSFEFNFELFRSISFIDFLSRKKLSCGGRLGNFTIWRRCNTPGNSPRHDALLDAIPLIVQLQRERIDNSQSVDCSSRAYHENGTRSNQTLADAYHCSEQDASSHRSKIVAVPLQIKMKLDLLTMSLLSTHRSDCVKHQISRTNRRR